MNLRVHLTGEFKLLPGCSFLSYFVKHHQDESVTFWCILSQIVRQHDFLSKITCKIFFFSLYSVLSFSFGCLPACLDGSKIRPNLTIDLVHAWKLNRSWLNIQGQSGSIFNYPLLHRVNFLLPILKLLSFIVYAGVATFWNAINQAYRWELKNFHDFL